MDIVRFDYEETVMRAAQRHKRKISRFNYLLAELNLYFDEEEAERIAQTTMIEMEWSYNGKTIQAINYKAIVQRVLRNNNNIENQLESLKQELSIYFTQTMTNMIAIFTLIHRRQDSLLIFGYIAKMEKKK
eukprot:96052_1